MKELENYHAHKAKLSQLGDQWHKKIHYGSGPWQGDRFVFLYHHVLTDDIEVRYEVPNRKSELVAKIPLTEFDIDKLCRTLHTADNRTSSVQDKVDKIDRENAAITDAQEAKAREKEEEFTEKMRWAIRKDTGNHVAPMTVTKHGRL